MKLLRRLEARVSRYRITLNNLGEIKMKKRKVRSRTEHLIFRIRVDLHDRVKGAAVAEAKVTGKDPERNKTAWIIDAIQKKLAGYTNQ